METDVKIISQNISRFVNRLYFLPFESICAILTRIFLKSVEKSLKILKEGGFRGMIHTIKKEISMNKELRSKIELACRFSNNTPKIKERKFENR